MSMVGVRGASFAYLDCANKDPEYGDNPPTLISDRTNCAEFHLVQRYTIQQLPHYHVLYDHYNGTLIVKLEIGLANSAYMTVLVRFRKDRNRIG